MTVVVHFPRLSNYDISKRVSRYWSLLRIVLFVCNLLRTKKLISRPSPLSDKLANVSDLFTMISVN